MYTSLQLMDIHIHMHGIIGKWYFTQFFLHLQKIKLRINVRMEPINFSSDKTSHRFEKRLDNKYCFAKLSPRFKKKKKTLNRRSLCLRKKKGKNERERERILIAINTQCYRTLLFSQSAKTVCKIKFQ